jgi:hypothetical protein
VKLVFAVGNGIVASDKEPIFSDQVNEASSGGGSGGEG